MAISKPILEQTLDEYRKQMSVNGMSSVAMERCERVLTIAQLTALFIARNMPAKCFPAKAMATSSSPPV